MPHAEAIVEVGGPRITYRQLWDRAARVAGGLRALGVGAGDRVAIRLGNSLDWCLAFFGIQLTGAIAVPVNTRFSESEVEYVIRDSGSRLVISAVAAARLDRAMPRKILRGKTWRPSSIPAARPDFPKGR